MRSTLLFVCLIFVNYATGLYIKTIDDINGNNQRKSTKSGNHQLDMNEWSSFQRKLGLSDQKVEVLKSQKDQKATMDLLNRFMKENPKYVTISANEPKQEEKKHEVKFFDTYHTIVEQLRKAEGTLKTTLNFELADKSAQTDLKRSRRKIAVRMVSDMPSDKIDDLLAMFNQQHGLNHSDNNNDDDDADDETSVEYNGIEPMAMQSAMDPDYMYENLYEDEEDTHAPAKSYGSFQDLILQATRNQWQRELEETKLHKKTNEHFV